ncbi:MAG: alanine--tRNA ligase [Candidatus Altiarchaeota archaeon]
MAYDFRELKSRMKPEFHKNYGKYYPVESLSSIGFTRKVCESCGRGFWSNQERDFCDEPACSGGYRFIGEKLTRKKFAYKEAWDEYVKVFRKWDYVPIKRYPVVCRWYDELYFVNAGVNDFQPYVVAGQVPPPAPAVLEPQFCLRFPDIDSVGVTGRHYTGFIMVGQHTFNTAEKHVYFKDEGILQMHEFLTKGLGIKADEIFYHEDVWAGGGNFGPSMEFFSRGLELGNQVYMQYEVLPDGSHRELSTKVIDMGAGLERWSWFSQGVPMSYDTVFPKVMDYLYKETGVKPDKKIWTKFARYAGLLSFDEIEDAGEVWRQVASEVGSDVSEMKRQVFRMRALYAIADHTRTLLVAIHDGALPSNVGGGYNLRNILRRCWTLMDEFGFEFEIEKVFETHVKEFGNWYTELKETGSLWDIIDVEKTRFEEGKEKAKSVVERMVADGEDFTAEKLASLYDSQGIHPNVIREHKKDLKIPDNFYQLVDERHEKSKTADEASKKILSKKYPATETLYYEDMAKTCFEAKVVVVEKEYVVLDKTLFYPEGGGQEADLGTLNGVPVIHAAKEGNTIIHQVKDPHKFKAGAKVKGCLDEARRRQLTQHHTTTHVINAAANKVLGPHIWQAGAHKSVESARLDVTHYKAVSADELTRIEAEANRIVAAGIKVNKMVLPREEAEKRYGFRIYQGGAVPGTELRIIDIAGVDAEACGGTHLDNTKDIGKIKVVKATRIQDGVVRIEFKAGKAAEEEGSKQEIIFDETISIFEKNSFVIKNKKFDEKTLKMSCDVFKVQEEHLPATVTRFFNEIKGLSLLDGLTNVETLDKACENLFQAKKLKKRGVGIISKITIKGLTETIEKKFKSTKEVIHETEGHQLPALMKIASDSIKEQGRVLVLVNIVGDKCNVVVGSSNSKVNAGEVAGRLSQALGGGGRGDARMGVGGGKSSKAAEILDGFTIK